MKVDTANSQQWQTNNQSYGQHYSKDKQSQSKTSGLRQKFAESTLDMLKRDDPSNFVLQQENVAQRQRHGLFNQPPYLSTGDVYKDKKPDQCKKNVGVNPHLLDNVQPELFSRMGTTSIGDPYKDPFRAKQLYDKEKNDMIPHGRAFIPNQGRKTIKHSEFEHMKEYNDKVYDTRDQNGNVKVGKRSVSTNPMKKGYGAANTGHLFSEFPYQGAPYDGPRDKERKDRAQHKAGIGQPFCSMSHTNHVFTPDYAALMNDKNDPYKAPELDKKGTKTLFGPWRATNPAKKGYNKTFQPFPQYIEEGDKPRQATSHERPWIHNFNGTSKNFGETLAKPCPVPSQMILNDLRRK